MNITSFDPSNGDSLGSVPVATKADIDALVDRARKAQKAWSRLGLEERTRIVALAFSGVAPDTESLAMLLSREMGKDIRRSSGEVMGVVQGAPYIAENARSALQATSSGGAMIDYAPLGVAAVISPWNYPVMMAVNLMVPALVAGNTVVFKPSEETPLVAQKLVEALNRTLPENVLQIMHGRREQGQMLVDADVNIIAFTGSMAAGQDIMRRAAGSVKRLVMELGGNDPMIVMNNADIEHAARFAVASSFENAGQMCTSTERVYVDEKVAERFENRVAEIAGQYRVGPWNMPGVNVGPIINETQRGKIIDHIDDAIGKGARVLLGGQSHPDHYVTPTVLADVTPDMKMEKEETFGPVVSIARFDDLDAAIDRANDSDYGLGAVVFGGDGASQVAQRLEAGMIGINGGVGGGGDAPWVGAKQSGFGFHGSAAGHRQFAQLRVIS